MSVGDGTFACALCSFSMTRRLHVRNHVESKHFPNTFTYPCPICSKEFGTNKAFLNHKNSEHKWFAFVKLYEIKTLLCSYHIFYSPSSLSLAFCLLFIWVALNISPSVSPSSSLHKTPALISHSSLQVIRSRSAFSQWEEWWKGISQSEERDDHEDLG